MVYFYFSRDSCRVRVEGRYGLNMSANMIVFHSPFLSRTELEDYNSMSPLLCCC